MLNQRIEALSMISEVLIGFIVVPNFLNKSVLDIVYFSR